MAQKFKKISKELFDSIVEMNKKFGIGFWEKKEFLNPEAIPSYSYYEDNEGIFMDTTFLKLQGYRNFKKQISELSDKVISLLEKELKSE